jgi:hypothetical protein
MARAPFLFSLDLALLAAVAFLQTPRSSGLTSHEWGAVAFAILAAVHLLLNSGWFADTLRYSAHSWRARVNLALNGALFVAVVLAVFSGLMISEVLAPTVGLERSPLHVWLTLHSVFSTITLALVGFHIALNWDWIVGVLRKRLFVRRVRSDSRPVGTVAAQVRLRRAIARQWAEFTAPMTLARSRALMGVRRTVVVTLTAVVVSAACFAIVKGTASRRDAGVILFGSLTVKYQPNRGWSTVVEPGSWNTTNSLGQSLREGSRIFGREVGVALLSIGAAAMIGRILFRLRLRSA